MTDKKIGEFTTERRYPVQFESIPKHVIQAFLAAEDAKFYEHKGIDYNGILRAIFSNLVRGRYAQGGSTITQQVARALLLETKKKEITRKIREMILSLRMERELSKREILNLYLSEIYLGHGAFGIGAAAKNYFGKKVQDLNVGEASILAGLPQRPNEWNPFHNPYLAKRRQLYVLKRMVEEGFISEKVSREAYETPLHLRELEDLNSTVAPYFTEYVRHHLMTKYGSENILSQGYKVYTTVRFDAQKTAEKSLNRGLREVDKRLGWRGVTAHLDSQIQMEAFKKEVHAEILENLNPMRLLASTVTPGTKSLEYDLEPYLDRSSKYVGASPVHEGEDYRAVVSSIQDAKNIATAEIGFTIAQLPFASLDWVKVDGQPVKRLSQFLKVGDVIEVKVEHIDKHANLAVVSLDQEPDIQGAVLSYETQTGFVRAMVGGRDFKKSKFNCALQAKRQVGSTFKPLIYAAAIDKGFSPSSIVNDSPIVFKLDEKAVVAGDGKMDPEAPVIPQNEEWKPHNYENRFEGDIPLRFALIHSMNVPTVKLLNEITIDYGIQYARTLGITATLPRDLTIGLGSWSSSLEEIMRAYAIFPRLGKPVTLNYIKKIVDGQGNTVEENSAQKPQTPVKIGKDSKGAPTVQEAETQEPQLVISPQTAYVMTDMLKGVIREGTGKAASGLSGAVAGKTGTTSDHRDAWFVGYSPYVMTGVWLGYEKDKQLDTSETGGKAAAPIWAEYMKNIAPLYPGGDFPIPDDIVFAYVDKKTGRLAGPNSPNRVRVAFKVGTVPNSMGDNIPRIGEPGVRGTAAGAPLPSENNQARPELPIPQQQEDDTGDYLRQGYQ